MITSELIKILKYELHMMFGGSESRINTGSSQILAN